MENTVCQYCHHSFLDYAVFCPRCGKRLEDTPKAPAPVQASDSVPGGVIFAGVVLVAAIIGLIYGLSQLGQYNTWMGQLAVAIDSQAASQKVGLQALVGVSAVAGVVSVIGLIVHFARKS